MIIQHSEIEIIAERVECYYNLPVNTIHLKTRKREILFPRQVAMFFSKRLTKASLGTIGANLGRKDHATVLHACKTVSNLIDTDKKVRSDIEEMEKQIKTALIATNSDITYSLRDIFLFGYGIIAADYFLNQRCTGKVFEFDVCCAVSVRLGYEFFQIAAYTGCQEIYLADMVASASTQKVEEFITEIKLKYKK